MSMGDGGAPVWDAKGFAQRFVRPREGRTLIVGAKLYPGREDRRAAYRDAVGVDMLPGAGVDVVANLEECLPSGLGLFDHVECMSVLEHSRRPWKTAANIERLMNIGATLHVSVPFVWRVHRYPGDYWRFTRQGLMLLFGRISWRNVAFVHVDVKLNDLVPSIDSDGHPYMARTETMGFGCRWDPVS